MGPSSLAIFEPKIKLNGVCLSISHHKSNTVLWCLFKFQTKKTELIFTKVTQIALQLTFHLKSETFLYFSLPSLLSF